jgi:hypothetical protein
VFQPKRFAIRLSGNFMVSFFSPLAGANIVLDVAFIDTVYLGLISAAIITGVVAGREFERYKE